MARQSKGRIRGAAARERVDQELQKQKERSNRTFRPFTFWMPQGESGREVVILDDEPDFFIYEHNLKDPQTGKWGLLFECIEDRDACPICEATANSSAASYNLYMTCLDLKPFRTRKGEEIPFSRKLFQVKTQQQKKFLRRFEKEGTLRGAIFELSRDGEKSPAIGNDIEFSEFMPEDELKEYEREYMKDNKRVVEKCWEPYDYDEIFPVHTRASLLAEYEAKFGPTGLDAAVPGSREANEEEEVPERSSRRRSKLKDEEPEEEPPWEEEEGEEEEEERPRRRSAPSSRRKKADADDDDEAEEKPKRPRRPRRKAD